MNANRQLIYGRQPIIEVLKAQRREIRKLFVSDTARRSPEISAILELAGKLQIEQSNITARLIDEMTEGAHNQGVVLEVGEYPYCDIKAVLAEIEAMPSKQNALFLFLDHIEDPQNLGAILRTAECFGVDCVVIPEDRAAPVTPTVVRTSAGASEHIRIARVNNLVRIMTQMKEKEVWFFGLESIPEAKDINTGDFKGKAALVIGSEGHGLGRLVRETCDHLVKIQIAGKTGSLNASVATAIALYVAKSKAG